MMIIPNFFAFCQKTIVSIEKNKLQNNIMSSWPNFKNPYGILALSLNENF